jgi:hypothetical protein
MMSYVDYQQAVVKTTTSEEAGIEQRRKNR